MNSSKTSKIGTTPNELKAAKLEFLNCFKKAWENAAKAYDNDEINSERCLQARIYHELRNLLKTPGIDIYIETRIDPSEQPPEESTESQKRRYIDTTITYRGKNGQRYIVAGIELKFNSRGYPIPEGVTKDLETLSHLMNVKTELKVNRINKEPIILKTTSETIVVFCAFYNNQEKFNIDKELFKRHRPRPEYTSNKWIKGTTWRTRSLPWRLYLFGAITPTKGGNSSTKTTKPICNESYAQRNQGQ